MQTVKYTSSAHKLIADTVTPVNLYLKFRQQFSNCLLLESSDYNSRENNSKSFLCFNPQATFRIENGKAQILIKGELISEQAVDYRNFDAIFNNFKSGLQVDASHEYTNFNGLFGYMAYNSVQYFDSLKLENPKTESAQIPTMEFTFFKHILVFNHFNSDLSILENLSENDNSDLDLILDIIKNQQYSIDNFKLSGNESSNVTDAEYMEMVAQGKYHCRRGDVFQIVLSRQFRQDFSGDDFNVYRTLRSVNPSPYLFYYDYGDFRLFGSSPEAQIKISGGKAVINPIAGTYKRTGNRLQDEALAKKLSEDKKENAEHVMLVDLARNDLSRNAKNVQVQTYKEVQYFSHVIHLVSEVVGDFEGNSSKIMADTFPAGTLSGAPKYRAMQLIDKYENQDRGFYGGAVGFVGLNNDVNLAIAIRSFVSKNNRLYYQAGAGIVVNSVEESELAEVNNKLSALKKAVLLAEKI